jgi:hypothetical protein
MEILVIWQSFTVLCKQCHDLTSQGHPEVIDVRKLELLGVDHMSTQVRHVGRIVFG